jgi:transcriptional regulator with XRE-family HTH domain
MGADLVRGTVLLFPRRFHQATRAGSADQRSGRNSLRGTPLACSMATANSAGTPRLERISQYQTCDCVVPIRSAKGFCPPTAAQARLSASRDIQALYRSFGKNQPKTLWKHSDQVFGTIWPMKPAVNPKELGARVARRRRKLGLSQAKLARLVGMSQQGIASIELGHSKSQRLAEELAEVLQTTQKWLKYEEGPEVVVPVDPKSQLHELVDKMNDAEAAATLLRWKQEIGKVA